MIEPTEGAEGQAKEQFVYHGRQQNNEDTETYDREHRGNTRTYDREKRRSTVSNYRETVKTEKKQRKEGEEGGGEEESAHDVHFIGIELRPLQTFEGTDSTLLQQRTYIYIRYCSPLKYRQLVTEDFVKTVVQEMPKKSYDLDPIPTSVLYDCLDEIIPIVTSIMNKSLSSGIVPHCFKHAPVKPLLKKVCLDPNSLKHYRPVSNLPFLSKVLERIVLKQFLQHLQSHSLLEPFQSAYRKCHSTETALLRVVNDLLQASDSGCVSILSLLDLSAAFDTVDHNILITRLRSTFSCSGMVLHWFISYLSCVLRLCLWIMNQPHLF